MAVILIWMICITARFVEDPHLSAVSLLDELRAAGFDRSYPTSPASRPSLSQRRTVAPDTPSWMAACWIVTSWLSGSAGGAAGIPAR